MDVDKAIAWIHGRKKFSITPSLTRVQHLLNLLDNPENKINAIHIAGTNGKGSVVTYLSELFQATGYDVGTFMSPYIDAFNERININSEPISDTELVKLIKKIQPLVEEMDQDEELSGITEFEIITVMMFYYFATKQLDIVILEVGLGGTYDPTNVITNPLLTAITTISDDHTDILGSSLLDITKQKVGIFKPEVPAVLGNLPSECMEYCVKYAKSIHSPVYEYSKDYQVEYLGYSSKKHGEKFNYKDSYNKYKRLITPLLGEYQVQNASLALQIFDLISQREKLHLSTNEIQKALNNVKLSGRMEVFQEEPLIILDGAHNCDAIDKLVYNLKNKYQNYKIHMLFASMKGKNYDNMIDKLLEVPNLDLTLTTFDIPKAVPCSSYYEFKDFSNIQIDDNWRQAFFNLLKKVEDENDVIVITGSLYFISQVRRFLINANF